MTDKPLKLSPTETVSMPFKTVASNSYCCNWNYELLPSY